LGMHVKRLTVMFKEYEGTKMHLWSNNIKIIRKKSPFFTTMHMEVTYPLFQSWEGITKVNKYYDKRAKTKLMFTQLNCILLHNIFMKQKNSLVL
jgi:hypothetical protein